MPVYEYRCQNCEQLVSITRGMFDESTPTCPDCGEANLKRYFSSVSVVTSETDRARDVSWVDKDLARRLRKKSKGKLSPQFKDTLDRMESN
jgi:putative FmdB family regulatory protein